MRALPFFLLLCLSLPVSAEWYSEDREMMGTRVTVELWSEDEKQAEKTIEQAMSAMQQVDRMMNPLNPDSDLYRVNQRAFAAPVSVPEDLYGVVERALHYSRLSEGAFDISFASVGKYYDYRAGHAPTATEVAQKKERINYRAITLDPTHHSIAFGIDEPIIGGAPASRSAASTTPTRQATAIGNGARVGHRQQRGLCRGRAAPCGSRTDGRVRPVRRHCRIRHRRPLPTRPGLRDRAD